MKLWKLIEGGADSRIKDKVTLNLFKVAKYMVKGLPIVAIQDGNTALHVAVTSRNLVVVKVLLKHTPDLVNIQNNVIIKMKGQDYSLLLVYWYNTFYRRVKLAFI